MGDTIPKLFAAVMADRLTTFLTGGGRLSEEKKASSSTKAAMNTTLFLAKCWRKVADKARTSSWAGWTCPTHSGRFRTPRTIMDAVAGMGIPPRIQAILHQLATGSATTVETIDGVSEEIPIEAGVRQGCPASPILFNMAVERVLRKIKTVNAGYLLRGSRISTLAYADDLVLIASSPEEMRSLLRAADDAAIEAEAALQPKEVRDPAPHG